MKASELIEQLQEIVAEHGDLEVQVPVLGDTDTITHCDVYVGSVGDFVLVDAS